MMNALALSAVPDFSKVGVGKVAISPAALVLVNIEVDGRRNQLAGEASGVR